MSRENSVRSLEAKTFSGFAARCETGSSTEVRASACVADSSSLSKSRETKHGACTHLFGHCPLRCTQLSRTPTRSKLRVASLTKEEVFFVPFYRFAKTPKIPCPVNTSKTIKETKPIIAKRPLSTSA